MVVTAAGAPTRNAMGDSHKGTKVSAARVRGGAGGAGRPAGSGGVVA